MKRSWLDLKRKWFNWVMQGVLLVCSLIVVFPLLNVFIYVINKGLPAINWEFLTELPKAVGEMGGGLANGLIGSLILILLACSVGVPWGIATGIYLSEYGEGILGKTVRFTTDLMTSIPSILIGIFIYSVMVIQMKGFSAYAGGIALAMIMIPMVARTTEEMLKLVPDHIREAGLALGISRWKVIVWIVFKGSLGAVMTGIMLAVARVAGETAPLLFTAFNNRFWSHSLREPIASLPVQIYTYSISPYDDWHRQAWAGAFILVVFVFILNLVTRMIVLSKQGRPQ